MENYHQNYIYQDNSKDLIDYVYQNDKESNLYQSKTQLSEKDQQNSVEIGSSFFFKERVQHPFIKRINNQQQNQSLGDQSNSLLHFPSSQHIHQKQNSRQKSIDQRRNQYQISVYEESQENKTNESFIYDSSYQNYQTEYNNEISKNQVFDQTNNQPHGDQKHNIKYQRSKSITIQKFNLMQANQASFRKKKSFYIFDDNNSTKEQKIQKNKLVDASQQAEHESKVFKKRNNLLLMDYQTQQLIWRTKWIQITSLVSKMKKIAHNSALFFRPKDLSELQVKLINDLSSNQKISLKQSSLYKYKSGCLFSYNNLQKIISFKKYMKIVKFVIKYFGCFMKLYKILGSYIRNLGIKVLRIFPLFHNLSFLYILWEAIICISSSILFIYIPFEYSFNLERSHFFCFYINYYCQIIFGLDIFVKFNTRSSEQGSLINQHLEIFTNYFKSSFIFDLISLLSLNKNVFNLQGIQFLFFLKISKSFRILEIIREQFLLKTKMFGKLITFCSHNYLILSPNKLLVKVFRNNQILNEGIISLLYLLGQIIYFGHLFTCLWNYIGLKQLERDEGWMVFYKYQNESITNRYTQIYYFATITMTTIGYGDFTAQTQLEKVFMIFIAFLSCGIFGYTINQIGNILYDLKQKRDLYHQELAKNNVELSLQCRARKYIQYLYSDENNDNISSIKSLSNLSDYLQKEIKTDVYIKKLKKIFIFSDIFSDEILVELSLQMKEAFYCHDQQIFQYDDENDQQLYFVNNGAILEYCQYNNSTQVVKEIQYFRQGQFFGLLAFLQGDNRRSVKYKSLGVSSLLKISYSSVMSVLKNHPTSFQKFCFIRDEVKFSNRLMKINSYCNSCSQQNHIIEECPYLFYEGKKQGILRHYFRQSKDALKKFKRTKTCKSNNALLNQSNISKEADQFYLKNIELFSMWDITEQSNQSSKQNLDEAIFQEYSKQILNEEKKINQEMKSDLKLPKQKSRESLRRIENKEISKQFLSDRSIPFQELDKNTNSQSYIQKYNVQKINKLERLSGEIQQMSENQISILNLNKNLDSLLKYQIFQKYLNHFSKLLQNFRFSKILREIQLINFIFCKKSNQHHHHQQNCQSQICFDCQKQSKFILHLFDKIRQEKSSQFLNPLKKLILDCKNQITPNKNESEINLCQKDLSNKQKQAQNNFYKMCLQIQEFQKYLNSNFEKQSQANYAQEQLFLYDFDTMNNFQIYYPYANAENIVEQANIILQHQNMC